MRERKGPHLYHSLRYIARQLMRQIVAITYLLSVGDGQKAKQNKPLGEHLSKQTELQLDTQQNEFFLLLYYFESNRMHGST